MATFAREGIGVAHCPTSNLRLGAGVARVRDLVDAGAPVGLGVDGSASNERSDLCFEVKQALLVARGRGGPEAMTAREALRLGTRGGAAVLGRDDIGSLEPGKRADVAVWRTDGLELGGADDLVAGWVLSVPHRVDRLYVGGEEVVRDGRLVRADEEEIARAPSRPGAKILRADDDLDARPRHRARRAPRRASASSSTAATTWSASGDDRRGRAHRGPVRGTVPRTWPRTGSSSPSPPSRFFRRVELEIDLDDADRHYHVPLLVSPYSCASYRGS